MTWQARQISVRPYLADVLVQRRVHLQAHGGGERGGVGGGALCAVNLPHGDHRVPRELHDVRAVL